MAELQRRSRCCGRRLRPCAACWIEDKRSAIALHYRSVPERGREVLKVAELTVAGLGPDFAMLVGKCVVEIRPRQLTKGAAHAPADGTARRFADAARSSPAMM